MNPQRNIRAEVPKKAAPDERFFGSFVLINACIVRDIELGVVAVQWVGPSA